MHTAEAMISDSVLPAGSSKLGYIDKHPADSAGLGYVILQLSSGEEAAWDGRSIRSLPLDWRQRCEFTPIA